LNRPPEASLADLVRVRAALGPLTAKQMTLVCEFLGVTQPSAASALWTRAPVASRELRLEDTPGPEPRPAPPLAAPTSGEKWPAPPPEDQGAPFEMRPLSSEADGRGRPDPQALAAGAPSELLPRWTGATDVSPLNLFNPSWQRAILSTALATAETGGEVDVDALVAEVVTGKPVLRLPQRTSPTSRRGVQLLLDLGQGMLPFLEDLQAMQRTVRDVVGRDSIEVLRFANSPLDGAGPRGRSTWGPYRPPAANRPVLILSTLGLCGPRSERAPLRDWIRFADMVRSAGCGLVAFVPLPATRLPAELARVIRLVPWDRPTRVRDVRPKGAGRGRW
jgi:hypothetical protein